MRVQSEPLAMLDQQLSSCPTGRADLSEPADRATLLDLLCPQNLIREESTVAGS